MFVFDMESESMLFIVWVARFYSRIRDITQFYHIVLVDMESSLEPELEAFLKDNPDFELNSNGRIHCKLTNHDIIAKMSEVEKYLKTKKYLHAKNWYLLNWCF